MLRKGKQTSRWRRYRQVQNEKRADEIQMAKVEAEKELGLKEMKQKAQTQGQASTSAAGDPTPRNRDAKSMKSAAFIDKKDELDSYLLHFEHYTENASWEKTCGLLS